MKISNICEEKECKHTKIWQTVYFAGYKWAKWFWGTIFWISKQIDLAVYYQIYKFIISEIVAIIENQITFKSRIKVLCKLIIFYLRLYVFLRRQINVKWMWIKRQNISHSRNIHIFRCLGYTPHFESPQFRGYLLKLR